MERFLLKTKYQKSPFKKKGFEALPNRPLNLMLQDLV